MHGLTVVEMPSAVAMCSGPLTPINANHSEIVKPSSTNSASYLVFKNAFRNDRKRQSLPILGLLPSSRLKTFLPRTQDNPETKYYLSLKTQEDSLFIDDFRYQVVLTGAKTVDLRAQSENLKAGDFEGQLATLPTQNSLVEFRPFKNEEEIDIRVGRWVSENGNQIGVEISRTILQFDMDKGITTAVLN